MPPTIFVILFPLIVALLWFINRRRSAAAQLPRGSRKLPPGPRGYPIIGHLHMLGELPHRRITEWCQEYGPIMYLRLGSVPTIVISSPRLVQLFLKTHDPVFANRPNTQANKYLSYGNKAIVFSEYGPYWRSVRKFCTSQLLSTAKIESMALQRRDELGLMVESLKKSAAAREVVDISEMLGHLIENMTCRMLFGKSRDERFDLNEIIAELGCVHGLINFADYFPILGPLDLQGLVGRFKKAFKTIDNILETIIGDHERDARNSDVKLNRDFVDVILSLKDNCISGHEQLANSIDRSNVKAIVLDMAMGALDTTHNTIDWIITELVRHSRVMKLVQEEIKSFVGNNEIVQEEHLPKLKYLDMVIKESMRLHPTGPLSVPRESMEDIVVDGYFIPKKSRILVNSWLLGRDPQIWSDNAESFLPERFIGSDIDIRGQSFELTPFGSGRRICPGIQLGLINVKLVVSQLVHSFNWDLPYGMSPDEIDMTEKFGLTMPRAKHLCAIPSVRPT